MSDRYYLPHVHDEGSMDAAFRSKQEHDRAGTPYLAGANYYAFLLDESLDVCLSSAELAASIEACPVDEQLDLLEGHHD